MKIFKQAARYGRQTCGRCVSFVKEKASLVLGFGTGIGLTIIGSEAFAQTADAALDSIDVGTELTAKSGKLGGVLGIAIGVMLILAAIAAGAMWARRSLKSK